MALIIELLGHGDLRVHIMDSFLPIALDTSTGVHECCLPFGVVASMHSHSDSAHENIRGVPIHVAIFLASINPIAGCALLPAEGLGRKLFGMMRHRGPGIVSPERIHPFNF